MKIRVSKATPLQLDWLVAKCEGKNGILHDDGITRCIVIAAASGVYKGTFKPTVNWCQGGPIIEREHIGLISPMNTLSMFWTADIGYESKFTQFNHDPLVAAMRCFVASRLGDEVEVPEGLL